jgi:diaminohydroxyphosphoribosylaminopyrimidine deaminase/5-amino-6-(5-phosphoribosylamino)uracil reductase
LRANHDAILVGVDTAIRDDPELTCRLPGLESRSPVRIVLDSRLRIPEASKLVQTARAVPLIVFTAAESDERLTRLGVQIERVAAEADGRPQLDQVLHRLAARGITRVLVEGGPKVHAAFLGGSLADAIHIYRAPLFLGEGGRSAVGPLRKDLAGAPRFMLIERQALGPDVLESYVAPV